MASFSGGHSSTSDGAQGGNPPLDAAAPEPQLDQIITTYAAIKKKAKFDEVEILLLEQGAPAMRSTWLNYYKDYFRVMVVHAVYEQRFVLEGLQNDKSFFKRIAQEKPAVFQLHNLISAVRNGRTAPGKKPAPGFVETLRLRLLWERTWFERHGVRIVDEEAVDEDADWENFENVNREPIDFPQNQKVPALVRGKPQFSDQTWISADVTIPKAPEDLKERASKATFKCRYVGNFGAAKVKGKIVTSRGQSSYSTVLNILKRLSELGHGDAVRSLLSDDSPEALKTFVSHILNLLPGPIADETHELAYRTVIETKGDMKRIEEAKDGEVVSLPPFPSLFNMVATDFHLVSGGFTYYCTKCNNWLRKPVPFIHGEVANAFLSGRSSQEYRESCQLCNGHLSATKKFSPSDRAVLLLPNNSLQWTQMKYIFKAAYKLRRQVVLQSGVRYICKAAYFRYVPTNSNSVGDKATSTHAVALIFPRDHRQRPQIIDSNHQFTDPGHKGPAPKRTHEEIDQNQVGHVRGLVYVRVNHPSKVKEAAERRKIALKQMLRGKKAALAAGPRVLPPRAAREMAKAAISAAAPVTMKPRGISKAKKVPSDSQDAHPDSSGSSGEGDVEPTPTTSRRRRSV